MLRELRHTIKLFMLLIVSVNVLCIFFNFKNWKSHPEAAVVNQPVSNCLALTKDIISGSSNKKSCVSILEEKNCC